MKSNVERLAKLLSAGGRGIEPGPGLRLFVRRPGLALVWIVLGAAVPAVLAWALWQTPSTLVSASLHTESLTFRVASPESARLAFAKAKLLDGSRCLANLLVEPQAGATVAYTRPARQSLKVSVTGPVRVTHATSEKVSELDGLLIEVQDADGCATQPVQRLPVRGDHAIFGSHAYDRTSADDDPLTMLSGRLTVYGRALSTVLGIPLSTRSARNALYVAGEVPLPAGSVIEEPDVKGPPGSKTRTSAMWSGFAHVDFKSEAATAIQVEASTNATAVTVFLPAPNLGQATRSSDPETVSLSLMARLTGDPNLLLVYGVLGVVAVLLGLASTARELVARKDDA